MVFLRKIMPCGLLRDQQQLLKVKRGLTLDCATQFSSKYVMLTRLLDNKACLAAAVEDPLFIANAK